jgi:hypothetical protein
MLVFQKEDSMASTQSEVKALFDRAVVALGCE